MQPQEKSGSTGALAPPAAKNIILLSINLVEGFYFSRYFMSITVKYFKVKSNLSILCQV